MTTKTRPSLPTGKPKNGISQWDNEGGAPSSGDRSRKQGGRPQKIRQAGQEGVLTSHQIRHESLTCRSSTKARRRWGRLMREIAPLLDSSHEFGRGSKP
jgi:hypothetical protein